MRKKFLLIVGMMFFLLSCQQEDVNELSSDNLVTVKYHYKGKIYPLNFSEQNEELILVSEIPSELQKLDEIPELAIVVDVDNIYLFDNEKEKFEYYNMDYSEIERSRERISPAESNLSAPTKNSSLVTEFNSKAKFHIDSYWNGSTLSISSLSQLRNLKDASFNDKISSINIYPSFVNPTSGFGFQLSKRNVICYEHANFSGISVEFTRSFYRQFYNGLEYYGHRRLKSLNVAWFKTFNDRISSIDIIQDNVSLVGSGSGSDSGGGSGSGGNHQ